MLPIPMFPETSVPDTSSWYWDTPKHGQETVPLMIKHDQTMRFTQQVYAANYERD